MILRAMLVRHCLQYSLGLSIQSMASLLQHITPKSSVLYPCALPWGRAGMQNSCGRFRSSSVTVTPLSDCTKFQPISGMSSRPTCSIHKFWGIQNLLLYLTLAMSHENPRHQSYTAWVHLLQETCADGAKRLHADVLRFQ